MRKRNFLYLLLLTLVCVNSAFAMMDGPPIINTILTEGVELGANMVKNIEEERIRTIRERRRQKNQITSILQQHRQAKINLELGSDVTVKRFKITDDYSWNAAPRLQKFNHDEKEYYANSKNSLDRLNEKIIELEEFEREMKENHELEKNKDEEIHKFGMNVAHTGVKLVTEHLRNEITKDKEIRLKREEIKGGVAKAKVVAKQITDFIKNNPGKILMITAGGVVLTYLGYRLIKFAMNRINKYLDTPDIVKETSRTSLKESIFGKPKVEPVYMNEIILAPALQTKLLNIANDIKNAHDANTYLFNLLLYGPPGTGKTMYAKALSYYTGLDYAIIPGSSLSKLPPSDALIKLNEILAWARTSPKGCILVFDEAESMLPNRLSESASERTRKLVTEFLAQIEKPIDKKLMFVLVTNIPEALDKAVLNRMSRWIEVPKPAKPELVKLIDLYSKKTTEQGVRLADGLDLHYNELAEMAANANVVPREIETIFKSKVVNAAIREGSIATYKIIKDAFNDHIQELKDKESFFNMGRV